MATTLEELFRTKVIAEGPNAGKTAEVAYAIRNSKDLSIGSSNYLLKKINENKNPSLLGGIVNGFDFIGKINERRKKYSNPYSESFVEQDQVGLKQFSILTRPTIYGGDIFRIVNGRTRTVSFQKRHTNQNISGGLGDKIGDAVANVAGDYLNNIFAGKKGKDALPPAPDLVALGTELAISATDSIKGALFPMPMIPSKVAEELNKRGLKEKSNIGNKKPKDTLLFAHEYNRNKALIQLANSAKVPNAIQNILKSNTNALSQSKDFLIGTATSLVKSLISKGVSKLVTKGVNALVGKKINKNKSNLTGFSQEDGRPFTPWSSTTPYSKASEFDELKPLDKQFGLKAAGLRRRAEYLQATGAKLPPKTIQKSRSELVQNYETGGFEEEIITENVDNPDYGKELLQLINQEDSNPALSPNGPDTLFTRRGMSSRGDVLNLSTNITYPGETAVTSDNPDKTFDDFDTIPLKFYSIALNRTVQFRCTVAELAETFSPEWEPNKFLGNPFPFYTYSGVERTLTFSFKIFSLSLVEHQNAWQRLNFLGGLTMPQDFKGSVGAVAPPLIKFTLGDMYKGKDAIIDSLTFTVDTDTPWEIGLNKKLLNSKPIQFPGVAGFLNVVDPEVDGEGFKLPMIINAEVSLKFLESRATMGKLYSYGYNTEGVDWNAPMAKTANGLVSVRPDEFKL
jgi:hypothetical protein